MSEEAIKVVYWDSVVDEQKDITLSIPQYGWGWQELGGRHWFCITKYFNRGVNQYGRVRRIPADDIIYTVSEFAIPPQPQQQDKLEDA